MALSWFSFSKLFIGSAYIILYLIYKYLEAGGPIPPPSEDVHVLITRICDYVALYIKRTLQIGLS